MITPNIVCWDIETGYNQLLGFDLSGPRGSEIPYKNVRVERYIISGAWRWLGEKKIHGVSLTGWPTKFKKNPHDDYMVVLALRNMLNEADFTIAHYGDKFDYPYFLARCAYNNIDPPKPPTLIDTWKLAHALRLNSYRLDYLARYFGLPPKSKNEWDWWIGAFEGVAKDVNRIYKYNKQDIVTLEHVFLRLRRYLPRQINMRMFGTDLVCAYCGGKATFRGNYYPRSGTRRYKRVQCQVPGCMAWDHMSLTEARKYGYKGD